MEGNRRDSVGAAFQLPPPGSDQPAPGGGPVCAELVGRWEAAYRDYGSASQAAASGTPGDPLTASGMASASWAVAVAWREIADHDGLPWWSTSALRTAAQAFEFQSRDWQSRAEQLTTDTDMDRRRQQRRVRGTQ